MQPLESSHHQQVAPPRVIEYTDYRLFLRDTYRFKKSLRQSFSFRRFSKLAGLKSPNYLQLVIEEKRNLTPETAERIAQVLKLNPLECEYFVALVREAGTSGGKQRTEALRERLVVAKKIISQFIDSGAKEVLSKWHHLLVRELVQLKDFEPSGKYISEKLCGVIDEETAMASFQLLLQLGFVKVNPQGKFEVAEPVLSTGMGIFQQSHLQSLHRQVLRTWALNLPRLNPELQETHYLNIPISEEKIPELRERIQNFQDEIIGWLMNEERADRLVQLGTYLIPYN